MTTRSVLGFENRDVLLAVFASLVISTTSYLITDEFVAIWLPRISAYGSAIVHGFPLPYFAYFPTNEASQLYYPLNFAGDFAIWFAVCLLIISSFTFRRLVLASVCGAVATASTLLLSPLALASPEVGNMEASGTSMGFPFEYLIRIQGGFGLVQSTSYYFSLARAAADCLLWVGVAFALIGLLALIFATKHVSSSV
jgi:hypothetical protein